MSTQLAQTTDSYPVPDGYCYACGFRHHGHDVDDHLFLPEPAAGVLGGLVYGTIPAELGLPAAIDRWRPAHIEALRALIAQIQDRVDIAELCSARRAAANR